MNISALEPTRYEIAAWHADGRQYLVCYAAGSPSFRAVVRAVRGRSMLIVKKLGLSDDAVMRRNVVAGTSNRQRPAVIVGDWMVGYTGRTQRDVRNAGDSYEFVGA